MALDPIALRQAAEMRPFTFDQAFNRHPEIGPAPFSVRDLAERFDTGDSVAALLRRMGPFVSATDAFRFKNDFAISAEQAGDFLDTITDAVVQGVVKEVVSIFVGQLEAIDLNPIPFVENRIPNSVIDFVNGSVSAELTARIVDLVADPVGSDYGRCGGMAFAGYDFYLARRSIDAAIIQPPSEGPLGDYIYERLLDSLRLNVGTFIRWVVQLHLVASLGAVATAALEAAVANVVGGPIAGAILAVIAGRVDIFDLTRGPEVLLEWTKDEWTRLKVILDHQAAWPIGLIFGDKPFFWDQHQVLAIGYTDNGPGQEILEIWDNENANRSTTMPLDFSGEELEVAGGYPTVKGFFHEQYTPQRPPQGI